MGPWRCPTRLYLRPGAIESLLPEVAASLGRAVAIVTDAGVATTPVPAAVEAALRAAGLSLRLRFDRVEANPSGATAEALAEELRSAKCDLVVAVGGGSVIDAGAFTLRPPGMCAR